MNFELLTKFEFLLFCIAVYSCRKDPVLFNISSLFATVYAISIFYYPQNIGQLAFLLESFLCLALGLFTVSQSLRAWSMAIGAIMGVSILLRLLEFSDYNLNGYKNELTWLYWIHITTIMEATVFLAASNGLLQFYTRDRDSNRDYKQFNWFNIIHNQTDK